MKALMTDNLDTDIDDGAVDDSANDGRSFDNESTIILSDVCYLWLGEAVILLAAPLNAADNRLDCVKLLSL